MRLLIKRIFPHAFTTLKWSLLSLISHWFLSWPWSLRKKKLHVFGGKWVAVPPVQHTRRSYGCPVSLFSIVILVSLLLVSALTYSSQTVSLIGCCVFNFPISSVGHIEHFNAPNTWWKRTTVTPQMLPAWCRLSIQHRLCCILIPPTQHKHNRRLDKVASNIPTVVMTSARVLCWLGAEAGEGCGRDELWGGGDELTNISAETKFASVSKLAYLVETNLKL